MEFGEFKEKFEEKGYYLKEIVDCTFEISIKVNVELKEDGEMIASSDSICEISLLSEGGIVIGKYDTLSEAYLALREICRLNNVEME